MTALQAIRAAILAQLTGDAELVSLLSGGPIGYRPRQEPPTFPSVTYFDFGVWDAMLPVTRRTVQIDIWDTNLNRAEIIAERIRTLLDFNQARTAGLPPVVVDTTLARIDYFGTDVDQNDLMP